MNKYLSFLVISAIAFSASMAQAEEDTNMGSAAIAGAGAAVISEAAVDEVSGTNISKDPWWKRAIKRAMSGAATGAAAVTAGKKDKEEAKSKSDNDDDDKDDERESKKEEAAKASEKAMKSKEFKDKSENRPPGWDKGKKKGWGDSDLPPGLQKKQNKP